MVRLALHHRIQARTVRALLKLPDRALLRLVGERPLARDGLVLDAQVQFLMAMERRLKRPLFHELPVEGARREMEVNSHILAPQAPPLADVRDDTVPGPGGPIPVRIYRPRGVPRPAPALVYFHGGGFVVGSLDSHDPVCRFLADGTFTFVNDVYCRTFGRTAEQLLGNTWRPIVEPADLPMVQAKLAEMSPDNPVVRIENRVYDGQGRVRCSRSMSGSRRRPSSATVSAADGASSQATCRRENS